MAGLSTANSAVPQQETMHGATTISAPPFSKTYRNIAHESSVRPWGLAAAFQSRDLAVECPDGMDECSDTDTRACCLNYQYCTIYGGINVSCVSIGSTSSATTALAPASKTIASNTEELSAPSPSFSSSAAGDVTPQTPMRLRPSYLLDFL